MKFKSTQLKTQKYYFVYGGYYSCNNDFFHPQLFVYQNYSQREPHGSGDCIMTFEWQSNTAGKNQYRRAGKPYAFSFNVNYEGTAWHQRITSLNFVKRLFRSIEQYDEVTLKNVLKFFKKNNILRNDFSSQHGRHCPRKFKNHRGDFFSACKLIKH